MARRVIVDAGPLIALAGIDALGILQALFGQITVPDAVQKECMAKEGPDTARIAHAIEAGWLLVEPTEKMGRQSQLMPSLGTGESAAIFLAMVNPGERLLILDDRLARRYGLRRGLPVIGTVRVLAMAESRGLVQSAAHCMDAMAKNGYRVSRQLLEIIRQSRDGQD